MDADPLIQAAQANVEKKMVYDLPALVLLGGLLVYRHTRPSTQLYRVVDAMLNAAVVLLDRLRALHRSKGYLFLYIISYNPAMQTTLNATFHI